MRLYENEGYVQFTDQVPYWRAREYANSNTHYLNRYGIEVEVVDILINEADDTITVRVAADLAPLFPEFGLALDHTVVREGEAQVRLRAWMPRLRIEKRKRAFDFWHKHGRISLVR